LPSRTVTEMSATSISKTHITVAVLPNLKKEKSTKMKLHIIKIFLILSFQYLYFNLVSQALIKPDCGTLDTLVPFYDSLIRKNNKMIIELYSNYDLNSTCNNVKLNFLYKKNRLLLNIDSYSKAEQKTAYENLIKEADFNKFDEYSFKLRISSFALYMDEEDEQYQKELFNFIEEQTYTDENIKYLAYGLFNHANYFNKHKAFNISMPLYRRAIEISKEHNISKIQAMSLMQLAFDYRQINDLELAIEYGKKSITLQDDKVSKRSKFIAYNNLSHWLWEVDEIDSALYYLKKAELIYPANIDVISSKARLFTSLNQLDSAEFYIEKAILLNDDKMEKDNLVGQFGVIKEKQKQYAKAEKLFLEAINYSDTEIRDFHNQRKIIAGYLRNYFLKNSAEFKVKQIRDMEAINDSIIVENTKNEISQSEIKYNTKLKEAQNNHLIQQNQLKESKLKTQRILIGFGSIGIILLSLLSFIIFKQKRKQKKLNEKLAEINVKISLISREIAHRSKNQLALATNLISYQKNKAEDIGAKLLIEESENKLKALSAVNRRLSDDDELSRVNLKEVIEEVVSNNIYSLSSSKIDYDISLPDKAIDSSKMSLIALIINELTTNSIKHAFEDNPNPIIKVQGKIENDNLSMEYSDNGLIEKQVKTKGIGQNLISGLVNQLQGKYKIDVSLGFAFKLNIPI